MDSDAEATPAHETVTAEEAKPENEVSVDVIDAEAVKVRSLSINEDDRVHSACTNQNLGLSNEDGALQLDGELRTAEPKPGCSTSKCDGTEGIKKSNSFHRRNYRKNNQGGFEDSNDGVEVAEAGNRDRKVNARVNDSKRHSEDDTSEEKDLPRSKYMKSDAGNSNSVPEEQHHSSAMSTSTSSVGGDSDFHDFSADEDHDRAEESNDDDDDSVEFEDQNISSSSTSSGGIVFEDKSSSSSSSSDNFLADLEEPSSPNTADTNAAVEASSSPSSQTSQPKPKTDSKKKPAEIPNVLRKIKPKHKWIAPREILRREIGLSSKAQPQAAQIFRAGFYGSLFSAERLELMSKLNGHTGCVNCLNFNYAGTKLASGSDDLEIKLWNYSLGKCLTSFHSGHRANVFQAKFVPYVGLDTVIVSCARDNQVRLNELSSSGEVRVSRKLAQHRGPAHKLSLSPENPHVVLSCGEDSVVFSIDIREDKPNKLLSVRENGKKVSLYSIHQNPICPQEFCVAGKDQYVRIYDARKLRSSSSTAAGSLSQSDEESSNVPVKKFCPHLLSGSRESGCKAHVTCACFNYNGRELLCSYNDENIYLFDTSHSDGADYVKSYEGHRNSATVKGVNFFGDRSQFVVSGSDCGHVFLWDKETESIVNFFRGDESGVVNCLEGHPNAPILATSGLDDDIKIWVPSHEKAPQMMDLATTVKKNIKRREHDSVANNQDADNYIMWALINQMRSVRPGRHRVRVPAEDSSSDDSWEPDEDDEDEDDDGVPPRGLECVIA